MSSYYRGSVWCTYCGFTDSQMLESVLEPGGSYGNNMCPCACLVDTKDYEWPLSPLLIYGKNGNPRLPMEMGTALTAPSLGNKMYPVATVHPLWLQMELMRLFPETLDDEARQMGIEVTGHLGPVGSFSPWTHVPDVDPREGRLPQSPFGPIGSPVLMNMIQNNHCLLPGATSDESVPWPPSPCPSPRPTDDDAGARMQEDDAGARMQEDAPAYPFVPPRYQPAPPTTTERGPRPACETGGRSGRSARRYPPKPPRFATKKRFRMY